MRYEIMGDSLPVVICHLDKNEAMFNESGAMAWMSPNMKMETSSNGGLGKALGRMFAGEKLFQNIYTAQGGEGLIAFASSFPGSIVPFEIGPGKEMIFQKRAFLAGEMSIQLSVHFNKKIVVQYDLQPGQTIVVDTGNLAAYEPSVNMEIQTVPGMKNMLFGGEGIFNTVLTGPGKVWLQTMPISSVAAVIRPYIPTSN